MPKGTIRSRRPACPAPAGIGLDRAGCIVSWLASKDGDLGDLDLVTSLAGKEQELLREVELYQLDIFGLTSTHCAGPGTRLLKRRWTLSFLRVQCVWGYS